MKISKYLLVFALCSTIISCSDYLDESPSKTSAVVPTSIDDLETLLNNYNQLYNEYSQEVAYGTDDFAVDVTLYQNLNNYMQLPNLYSAVWDTENQPAINSPFWNGEWKKVFYANMILETLPKVSGTAENKAQLEAEAHFIRAYSYFQLANVYCLPYSTENMEEMGLPIKTSGSFEQSLVRASLKETWDFMEADLAAALKITRTLQTVNGLKRTWRASTVAVKGFAARFYLAKNDYTNAQSYAEKALAEQSTLRNYNTEMRMSTVPAPVTIFNPTQQTYNIQYPYTHDLQGDVSDRLKWGESYFFRTLSNGYWNYFPSQNLLNCYDKTYDLRYKYHIVEGYSYSRGAVRPAYDYPAYIFFFKSDILNGPSTPEMLLIKAECEARKGQWAQGIQTVNQLRIARFDVAAPANVRDLSASSQGDALAKILLERRREMPFTTRWADIRRFNNNDNPADDVLITRTFLPYSAAGINKSGTPINYTLELKSRKFARPIPYTEIVSSQNQIVQNKY
ncbi:RagB/SusD family nutrient uptake outer membrane protein [Flavobacterium sp. YO12]|uniref:RagB/SusD family nutrient uptake outer membrane protein n=1 Tax=Flavobacterium sp. YO12 TaxID=1920029 RepID=UPI00100B3E6F|nr:RagB/SusD family nutrient uptake outer membrane protein [Flavobacterium sp. YO12]RXM48395.1 RagB/SusD family nutrient uptake outer membrane protein [Flavobacterium sp. YO12]